MDAKTLRYLNSHFYECKTSRISFSSVMKDAFKRFKNLYMADVLVPLYSGLLGEYNPALKKKFIACLRVLTVYQCIKHTLY